MKIRWPRLTFPPINLWTAPHQPALEDIMTAAERDSVQDQLCARIDELEREKEVLAAQMDKAEAERDEAFAKGKQALDDLRRVEAEMGRLRSFRSAVCGWRESDWPESFCRRTAELVADHGRQAEGGDQ